MNKVILSLIALFPLQAFSEITNSLESDVVLSYDFENNSDAFSGSRISYDGLLGVGSSKEIHTSHSVSYLNGDNYTYDGAVSFLNGAYSVGASYKALYKKIDLGYKASSLVDPYYSSAFDKNGLSEEQLWGDLGYTLGRVSLLASMSSDANFSISARLYDSDINSDLGISFLSFEGDRIIVADIQKYYDSMKGASTGIQLGSIDGDVYGSALLSINVSNSWSVYTSGVYLDRNKKGTLGTSYFYKGFSFFAETSKKWAFDGSGEYSYILGIKKNFKYD